MQPIDICFTPLDIPKRPNIDLEKFLQWAKLVYPQSCKDQAKHAESVYKDEYPWDLVFAKFGSRWQDNFDIQFPNLAKYCYEGFNLKDYEIQSVIFLLIRDSVKGYSFWHNDIDLTGFRFYLENENFNLNPLMLRKTKLPYTKKITIATIEESSTLLKEKEYICKIPDPHSSFYLNNLRSAHSIFVTKPGLRIAGFITIGNSYLAGVMKRTSEIIVRSAEKFKEYAVLYQEE